MVQAVAIHPGDGINIQAEEVVADCDGFNEPRLLVQRAVSDSQVKDVSEIHAAEKPAKDEIGGANQHSQPRSQVCRRKIRAGQQIEQNDSVADDVVDFHDESSDGYSNRN